MSRGRRGMQGNVAAALGFTARKGPPELQLGRCHCGYDLVLGTDRESPILLSAGAAYGRVIEYCPECRKVARIDQGPPSYLQSLEQLDRVEYAELTGGWKLIDRRYRKAADSQRGKVPRAAGARDDDRPSFNSKQV